MKKITFLFSIALILGSNISCRDKTNVRIIRKGEYILQGQISKDTILNGPINYYDTNHILDSKFTYSDNVKNGEAIHFYPNGKLRDSSYFYYGLQNGYHIIFDSIGKVAYKDYYYYGKQIGPLYFYTNGMIQQYYFTNFEGENIFYTSYDSLGIVEEQSNDFFPMNIQHLYEDDKKKIKLSLYILQPPNFIFDYKIGLIDSSKTIKNFVNIPSNKIFYETFLSYPPNGNTYCLSMTKYDLITKKKQTFIKQILLSNN